MQAINIILTLLFIGGAVIDGLRYIVLDDRYEHEARKRSNSLQRIIIWLLLYIAFCK